MADITWIKPSGVEITTNDAPANVAYAEEAGWTRKDAAKPRRRPRQEQPAETEDE